MEEVLAAIQVLKTAVAEFQQLTLAGLAEVRRDIADLQLSMAEIDGRLQELSGQVKVIGVGLARHRADGHGAAA